MGWLLVVSLVWALSFGLIKRHLTTLDPAWVACVRLILSLLVFLPLTRVRSIRAWALVKLMGLGAVQFGLMYVAYIAAFHRLQAHQVALLTLTTPIFVSLCSNALARKFDVVALVAASLALLGAAIALHAKPLGYAQWQGIVWLQFSNVCFAIGQVLYRHWKREHPETRERESFAWLYLGGVAATLPFLGRAKYPGWLEVSAVQWGVLLYLGVVASGVGFFLWNRASVSVRSAQLAVMNNAKIPLAIAVSVIAFGERANWLRLGVGTALMLVAGALATRAAVD